MSNPIQYTSRTFATILNDINSDDDLIDKPEWWKRIWAGIGDVLSVYLNAQANQTFLSTSFTRQAVTDLCRLIDYELTPHTTSSGIVLFYLDPTQAPPYNVVIADLIALSEGSLAVSSKRFEARAVLAVAAVSETFTVNIGNDQLLVARVYTTGERVRVSSTVTLPPPLAGGTDYYAVYVDDTHITLAESLSDAYAGTIIDLTAGEAGVHTIVLWSRQVTMYQQTTVDSYSAGLSDGITEWQEFDLADNLVLEDTITMTINSLSWTRVDTFIDSTASDRHFRLLYNTDGSSFVQFGDGTYGLIPPGFNINVDYAIGGESNSNISVIDRINTYGGTDANVTGVSNPDTLTGGADAEALESAKRLAPLLLKARDRFITVEDGEALVLTFGGITRTKILKNEFGLLSCKVVGIAAGGGNPSGAVKTALQADLIDRTILESIDVRVLDGTITATNVTSAAKILSGYVYADVEPFFDLAWKLFLAEVSNEIQTIYIDDGIAEAVTFINSHWTLSFTAADYTQITLLIENLDPMDFGDTKQESDAFGYIDPNVIGLDYLTIAAPAFPISLASDEITKEGAFTLTEI